MLPKLLRTGNPFHPVAVTVGGRTLLDGPAAIAPEDSNRQRYTGSLAGWLIYPLAERSLGRIAYSPDNGFGPQFAAAWLALPFALALALRRRRRLLARALLAAPATVLAWLALSPWEHPRYALTACGFALLGLAAVEEAASRGPAASPAARRLLRSTIAAALLFAAPAGLLAAAPELPRCGGPLGGRRLAADRSLPAASTARPAAPSTGSASTAATAPPSASTRPTFVAPLFGWHGRNRVVYAASLTEHAAGGLPLAGSAAAGGDSSSASGSTGWSSGATGGRSGRSRPPASGWIAAHPERLRSDRGLWRGGAHPGAARRSPRTPPAARPAI